MSVTFKLPPSGRNFEVFEAVIVGGKSTREAAEQFRLSQSRVCQIARRMEAWLAEVLATDWHLTDEEQLRLAKSIAGHRLNHLYCELMGTWRRSQGEFKQTRSNRYGDEVTTTKSSYGDVRYMVAATRLIKAAAERGVAGSLPYPDDEEDGVPVVGAAAHGRAAEAASPAPAVVRGANHSHPAANPTAAHPVEDCSQNGQSPQLPAAAEMEPAAAKTGSERTSAELSPQHALARRALLAPVQHDHDAELKSSRSGIQLQVTPDQPGVSSRPLSRQQRRKLQRALKRARA